MTDVNDQTPQSEIDSIIALFSNNQLQEALDKVKTLTKSFPEDSLLHNITGACYAGLGQLGSAVKCYEKAIEIKPDYAKAHYNLGNALHDLSLQRFGQLSLNKELDDPIKSYQRSIEIDPNYAEAHNNLGNVFQDLGRLDEALECFEKALIINPDYVEAHYSLGVVLFDLGQFDDAAQSYKKAIELNPNFAQAHNNLGNTFAEQGQLNDAIQSYQKALELNPNYSEAYNSLGNIFMEQGQIDDAVISYQKALEINPNYPALHNNLGNAYKQLGQPQDALDSYSKGLTYNPDYIDLLNNVGVILNDLGRFDEAVKNYKRAIAIKPDYAEAYNNLGVTYNKLGQLEEAVDAYEEALNIDPEYADAHNNLGVVLKKLGQLDEAIESYNKAIIINPVDADTYNNLGIVFDEKEQLDDAIQSYRKAVSIQPDLAEAYNNLGHTLCKLHRYQEALVSYEKVFDIKPNLDYIVGNILNTKMNCCDWDGLAELTHDAEKRIDNNGKVIDLYTLTGIIDNPKLQNKAAELFTKFHYPKNSTFPAIDQYPKHPKIRIGYFSADFREHPVGFLTAELYELHDKNEFEVHAFSLDPDSTVDNINLRIKAGVDQFHDVNKLSHKEIALFARSLEIDIAIDLGGFTHESRTDIFAMSAAPIQLSYIGYLGTMGADYYDYLIADPVMIPKESQKYYAEKIVYLPSFQVNDSTDLPPEITLTRKDVGLPEEGFVFCCFNNTYKFTPTIFDSWARILKQVENSVLIVYANNETSKANLSEEIKHRGVDPSRLIFGDSLPKPKYLARYRTADLFLDTHPYNAGTTASDALKMGLPIVTMMGQSFSSREAASILTSMNLPELITHSLEEYEALAIELATNPEKMQAIKDKLASNLTTAPLYNTKLFVKNLESAYTTMYERYHEGLEPDHIYFEDFK